MKIQSLLLVGYIVCCLMACSKDDIQNGRDNVSRDDAYQLVQKRLNMSLEDVDIWVSKERILAKSSNLSSSSLNVSSPDSDSWLFFIDELPMGNWGHDCKYLFVDMDGTVSEFSDILPPYGEVWEAMELINVSEARKKYHASPISFENVTKSGQVTSLPNNYAIIISGGDNIQLNYIRYWNDCAEIYATLTGRYSYDPSKVFVLMADGTDPGIDTWEGLSSNPDLDGDGVDDIDYAATNQNLDNVFDYLSSQLTSDDYLFIYTIDHGGIDYRLDESFLFMWNGEKYYASHFADKVKAINTKATNIVMGQCHSGGFIDFFTDSPNICISTACSKYETSWASFDKQFDEFIHFWTQSHCVTGSDLNNDNHISAWESFKYAQNLDSRNETPCHYGAGSLSKRLTLVEHYQNTYESFFDGFCRLNNDRVYSFYTNYSHLHEPEFGISPGSSVDITITQPSSLPNSLIWSITENSNYVSVFTPQSTSAYLVVNSYAAVGQRIRIKVEASVPEDNYYISQYLNFYITP